MSNLVDATEIERIVGIERHATDHYGRAVSAEQTVYVLHSQQCKDSGRDLRECQFSRALDRGIDNDILTQDAWCRAEDRPVRLKIARGRIVPKEADHA